ncbi:hypothetical protein COV49_03805 [Candidatus Falkowbacteria bacterium CG11_big_fil_rev_8_21_14_0_20_39_10]|uniref:Uncharacterized protein n=1 Tax=Candidatus Falkowbacteria bacterium CG11_big_fil_rev_8_21_14_0_20_39_10 TaxID=1974570 RepID=A0A2M6K8A9_9BACT|nr:MAG: hypothetical protein COV49_03805 [Candidatus Falkowbacteria bacterium CG11_big_fil_rev_8_21_14_0_20_39_10]
MKSTTKQLLSFFVLLAILFGVQLVLIQATHPAQAQSLWDQQAETKIIGENAWGGDTPKDPKIITAIVVRRFLEFLGIVFLILIIMGGFKYMTAQGNEENVTEALDQIKQGVIGLVIMLAAWSITLYVTKYITRAVTGHVW